MPSRLRFSTAMPHFARIAIVSISAMLCCQSIHAADREEWRAHEMAKTAENQADAKATDNGDVEVLTKYYRSQGFFQARVAREVDLKPRSYQLVVNRGPRYRVRTVKLVGNHRFTGEELSKQLKITAGNFFDQGNLDADLAALRKLYDRPGEKILADLRFTEEPGDVEMTYKITEATAPE